MHYWKQSGMHSEICCFSRLGPPAEDEQEKSRAGRKMEGSRKRKKRREAGGKRNGMGCDQAHGSLTTSGKKHAHCQPSDLTLTSFAHPTMEWITSGLRQRCILHWLFDDSRLQVDLSGKPSAWNREMSFDFHAAYISSLGMLYSWL